MRYPEEVDFSVLIGKIFTKVEEDGSEVTFTDDKGHIYKLMHIQDCCESVYIESIVGDLSDLENSPILISESVYSGEELPLKEEYEPDSYTWTFIKFATIKGYVDIRFYGTSNGYYSESADLYYYEAK